MVRCRMKQLYCACLLGLLAFNLLSLYDSWLTAQKHDSKRKNYETTTKTNDLNMKNCDVLCEREELFDLRERPVEDIIAEMTDNMNAYEEDEEDEREYEEEEEDEVMENMDEYEEEEEDIEPEYDAENDNQETNADLNVAEDSENYIPELEAEEDEQDVEYTSTEGEIYSKKEPKQSNYVIPSQAIRKNSLDNHKLPLIKTNKQGSDESGIGHKKLQQNNVASDPSKTYIPNSQQSEKYNNNPTTSKQHDPAIENTDQEHDSYSQTNENVQNTAIVSPHGSQRPQFKDHKKRAPKNSKTSMNVINSPAKRKAPKKPKGKRPTAKSPGGAAFPFPPLSPKKNIELLKKWMKDNPVKQFPRQKYYLKPSHAAYLADLTANLSSFSPEDQQFLESRVGVYVDRAKRVGRACGRVLDQSLNTPTAIKGLVWDLRHDPNLVWCQISKVASSTWMTNFLRLAHYRENDPTLAHLTPEQREEQRFGEEHFDSHNRHSVVYGLYPVPSTGKKRSKVLRGALRFIIVRHPLSRLLSAYLDKMKLAEPQPPYFDYKGLQKDIITKYRKKEGPDFPYPTFREFAQYVIDSTANLTTREDWHKVRCWRPYWTTCGVCNMDYQLIMKIETMTQDERFLVTLAELDELKQTHEWRNQQSSKNKTERNSYFQQLSSQQMKDLQQRYQLDFDLFGYTLDDYLPLAWDAHNDVT